MKVNVNYLHDWRTSPQMKRARPGKLAHSGLKIVQRLAHENEQDEVGQEERSAAILVSQVRKSPDIADANLLRKLLL